MAIFDLVLEVGDRLGRPAQDVEPYVKILEENWYDDEATIADADIGDLSALGLPRRFCVELASVAAEWKDHGMKGGKPSKSSSKGKGKSKGKKGKGKGKYEEEEFEEKGKGKGKSKSKGKSKDKDKGGGGGRDWRRTIPIDIDGLDTSLGFKFRPKLLGSKGTNVFHIEDKTGCTVELFGCDEEGWIQLELKANDEEGLEQATSMCEDLLKTVFEEYDELVQSGEVYRRGDSKGDGKGYDGGKSDKGKGKKGKSEKGKSEKGKSAKGKSDWDSDKGKGKGKSKKGKEDLFEERVSIRLSDVESDFPVRMKIVGENGKNVKFIEKLTDATVSVAYEDEDLVLTILHRDREKLAQAKEMCDDLVASVMEAAPTRRNRGGKSDDNKRSSSSAGKSRGDPGDERPSKRVKVSD